MKKWSFICKVCCLVMAVFMIAGCGDLGGLAGAAGGLAGNGAEQPTVSLGSGVEDEYSVHYGDSVTLSVSGDGTGTLSYQWYSGRGNSKTPISGATSATYTYTAPSAETEAYLSCKITNSKLGKAASSFSDEIHIKCSNIIVIDSNIEEAQTWDETYTYLVVGDVYVHAELTIPEGTVVKFEQDAYLGSKDDGTIKAQGADDNLIRFTSWRDSTVGIAIPGYGNPAKGDWEGLESGGASGSIFNYCDIRYAGGEYYGALFLDEVSSVMGCTFHDNKTPSDRIGALNITAGAADSTVIGNVFYNNDWPLSCPASFTVDTSNTFSLTDAESTLKNRNQAIVLTCGSNGDIEQYTTSTWAVTELPYFLAESLDIHGTLRVGVSGSTEPVIVRCGNGIDIDVLVSDSGAISIAGPCVFTSYRDDAHGGDIFGDGDNTAADGDWEGIYDDTSAGWCSNLNKGTVTNATVLYNNKDLITD